MASSTTQGKPPVEIIGGGKGKSQYGGQMEAEWLRELQGNRGLERLREMSENDGVIGGVQYNLETLIKQNSYYPQKPDATEETDTPADDEGREQCAEFVEQCMHDMQYRWSDFMAEGFTSFVYGEAVHQIAYKQRLGLAQKDKKKRSKYDDGKFGWRGFFFHPKSQIEKYEYDPEDGSISGMKLSGVDEVIKRERFLLSIIRRRPGYQTGFAPVRWVYCDWKRKKYNQEAESIAISRGPGFAHATVPPQCFNSDATSNEKAILTAYEKGVTSIQLGERMGLVTAAEKMGGEETGYAFKFEPAIGGGINIREAIRDDSASIKATLGMSLMALGDTSRVSFSLAELHDSLGERIMMSLMWSIIDDVNENEIPRLLTYNAFPQKWWPIIVPGPIAKAPLKALCDALVPLVNAAIIPRSRELAEYVSEQGGLPKPPEEQNGYAVAPKDADGNDILPTLNANGNENVQEQALNGAQVTALIELVRQVVAGQIPRDTAVGIIVTSYQRTPEQADALLGEAGRGFTPADLAAIDAAKPDDDEPVDDEG